MTAPRRRRALSVDLEDLDDAVLVEHVRWGDDDAALVLWRRHHERARTSIAPIIISPKVADAVLRRTFAEVVAQVRAGEDPLASFSTCLLTSLLLRARFDDHDPRACTPVVRAFVSLRRIDQLNGWEWVLGTSDLDAPPRASASHALALPALGWMARLHVAWTAEIVGDPSLSVPCVRLVERIDAVPAGSIPLAAVDRLQAA